MHKPSPRDAVSIATAALFFAAGVTPAVANAQTSALDAVVVTGTRASGSTRQTSMSPISVVSAEDLQRTGFTDIANALAAAEPSLNLPHAATTASSANTRPITLSGMAPDQVLVLINGKRWHSSAVLNFNNAVGRGSAPFDLNSLPLSAVKRIEVLRSGAAAQYGSDAIAGVVNIVLKSNAEGGTASYQFGRTERGDGAASTLQASTGLALGEGGHMTLSASGLDREATNRAGIDELLAPPRTAFVIGDPRVRGLAASADAALPVGPDGELYATLIGTRRASTSAAQYRTGSVSPLYPDGFVPRIRARIDDATLIAGYRHGIDAVTEVDASYSGGYSRAAFSVGDTANASLGGASPTQFDGGGLRYAQDVFNLALNRSFGANGNLALGLEARRERYRIDTAPGDAVFGSGAQGFPGLNPRIPVDEARLSLSAYADLEWRPTRAWTFGAAIRQEHYDDFGSATSGKLSARLQLAPQWALRGGIDTGFRAPSLQQAFFSSVTSASSNGKLVNVGTFQVRDPVARALGASDLRAETSRHESLGLVWTATPAWWLTADAYRTRVRDRIVLSDQLGGAAVQAALAGAGIVGVQQAQFFTNAADTNTRGFEAVLNYRGSWRADTLSFSSSVATFRTRLDRLAPNPVLPALPLLGTRAQLLLTDGQPRNKWLTSAAWEHGEWLGTLALTRYGPYTGQPVTSVQTFGAKWVGDVSLRWQLARTIGLTLGVQNLGDVYPDQLVDTAVTRQGFLYGEESPFGIAGRSFFARLDLQW